VVWRHSTSHNSVPDESILLIRKKGLEFVPDVMEARRYGPYYLLVLDSKSSGTILENFGFPERP
jgi:hypothetical protein